MASPQPDSEPAGFVRPEGWTSLPEPAPEPDTPAPPTAVPPPPPLPAPVPSRRTQRPAWMFVLLAMVLVALAVQLASVWGRAPDAPTPTGPSNQPVPTSTRTPINEPSGAEPSFDWLVRTAQLRPELPAPQFVLHPDGSIDGAHVIATDAAWVVLSGTKEETQVVLHGLDPASGQERWRRPLANALCADELLDGRLVCAEANDATGANVPEHWTVHLLDPATGGTQASRPFDGFLTLVDVNAGTVVLLEQRLPAPHAVVTGLGADLNQAWQHDLKLLPGHGTMFSDNRMIYRKNNVPRGLRSTGRASGTWPAAGSRPCGSAARPRSSSPRPAGCWGCRPAAASSTTASGSGATTPPAPRPSATTSPSCSRLSRASGSCSPSGIRRPPPT